MKKIKYLAILLIFLALSGCGTDENRKEFEGLRENAEKVEKENDNYSISCINDDDTIHASILYNTEITNLSKEWKESHNTSDEEKEVQSEATWKNGKWTYETTIAYGLNNKKWESNKVKINDKEYKCSWEPVERKIYRYSKVTIKTSEPILKGKQKIVVLGKNNKPLVTYNTITKKNLGDLIKEIE